MENNNRMTIGTLTLLTVTLLALPPVYGQTRSCQLPPQFPCPDARIMEFKADKGAIKPGESVVLQWVAENPGPMTVTPGVGAVVARGSARVSPRATTTYTLTVAGGPNGEVLKRSVTVVVEGTTPSLESTIVSAPAGPPRMPDGKPSLQGVFNTFGLPPRPNAAPASGGLPARPTLKPGMESFRTVVDPNVVVSECGVGTVPPSIGPYSFQIIQNSSYVVILIEYMHLFRVVPLDAATRQDGTSWMGDSVGHWDGDTLVIETTGFNTHTTVAGGAFRHSDALRMVERIRRIDLDTLEIETTLEDSKVFEGPWRNVNRYRYHSEHKKVDEFMCGENLKNYDYLVDPSKEIKLR
jgi:hypothetical protein